MKNTTTIAIAMALAVTAVPSMIWYYQSPDEPAPTPPPEPETSEPVMTEEHKQGLLSLGAVSFLKDIDEAKSYDLLSEAQVDEMKTAVWALGYESMPEDLMQALAAVDDGGEPYVTYYNQSSPLSAAIKFSAAFYEITDIFKDYLSPELNTFVTMIGGDKGCIGKFDRSDIKEEYTSRVHGHESGGDIRDEDDIRSVQMHMPDGAWNMKCENGADVNLLVYPSGEEEDVRVSYDFENVVAYFEKTGAYALENCEYENDCFSVVPFTELKDSEGLQQAFADKAVAEASLSEVKAQAQAYIAENWSQIEADLASVTKPAAPVPR